MIVKYVKSDDKRLAGYRGKNWGFITYIDEKYKDDKGLLEHERTHFKQFIKNPFMGLKYKYSKKWRSRYEIEAYAVQAKYCPDKEYAFRKFGELMSKNYGLDYSAEVFEGRIRNYYFSKIAKDV